MSEGKQRGQLSHAEIDDIAEAIRAARMIAETVSRTVCEGMRRNNDGAWELSPMSGDMLDYFTGEQVSVLSDLKTRFEAAVGSAGA